MDACACVHACVRGRRDGSKLNLHMMCLGKHWEPRTAKYSITRCGAAPGRHRGVAGAWPWRMHPYGDAIRASPLPHPMPSLLWPMPWLRSAR